MRRGEFVEDRSPRYIACHYGYNCNYAHSNPLTNDADALYTKTGADMA